MLPPPPPLNFPTMALIWRPCLLWYPAWIIMILILIIVVGSWWKFPNWFLLLYGDFDLDLDFASAEQSWWKGSPSQALQCTFALNPAINQLSTCATLIDQLNACAPHQTPHFHRDTERGQFLRLCVTLCYALSCLISFLRIIIVIFANITMLFSHLISVTTITTAGRVKVLSQV